MSKFTPYEQEKLITHTGGHRKVIINLEIAENVLYKSTLKKLNNLLIELNHVQEVTLEKRKRN